VSMDACMDIHHIIIIINSMKATLCSARWLDQCQQASNVSDSGMLVGEDIHRSGHALSIYSAL